MTIKTKITPLGAGNKVFYAVGQVLFESGVPGTYSLEVLTKVFCDIWISGGGGGGSNGAGGTGATLHIQGILLPGSYVLVVGNFGDCLLYTSKGCSSETFGSNQTCCGKIIAEKG